MEQVKGKEANSIKKKEYIFDSEEFFDENGCYDFSLVEECIFKKMSPKRI